MDHTTRVEDVLDYIAPFIVHGGRYARCIQGRVIARPAKTGYQDIFASALTDADLSIQGFIEVALLARFPELHFYGEEYEQSLNMKYFPAHADLSVYLDPVDGTRYFEDKLDNFNVILTITDRHEIQGAICYMPGYDKFFRAQRGETARVQTGDEVLSGDPGKPLTLNAAAGIVLTHEQPIVRERLSPLFKVVDVNVEYNPPAACLSTNSILLGESCAIVGRNAGLIDWAAIAFIASEAGAIVSDWDGSPPPSLDQLSSLRYADLIAAATPEIHSRIVSLLANAEPAGA